MMGVVMIGLCIYGGYRAIQDTSSMAARAAMLLLLFGLAYSCAS